MTVRKPLYLIDASIYVFRAWFSLPDSIQDRQGNPVNAVYGFSRFLRTLMNRTNGSHYAVAFDESLNRSFRNRIYPQYKANREPAPDELKLQFKRCKTMAKTLGLATFSSKRYEADDIIGTIATKMRGKRFKITIVSGDKDLSQLIQTGDTYWDFARDIKLNSRNAADHFGVKPSQMVDLLALMGDSVDNIPGVPGVGKKTAQRLLAQYQSLDNLYSNLHNLGETGLRGSRRITELLSKHKDQSYLSQTLARIVCDAPISVSAGQLKKKAINARSLNRLCNQLGFGDGLRTQLLQRG